jgi:fibrillarin-like rRNA methylase
MLSRKQFTVKFIVFFNLYGNLLFLGTALCAAAAFVSGFYALGFLKTKAVLFLCIAAGLTIAFAAGAAACVYSGLEISSQFGDKYKFYRVTIMRIRKNGFKLEYLEDCYEIPCYRLMVPQILQDTNCKGEYKKIQRRWKNMRYLFG